MNILQKYLQPAMVATVVSVTMLLAGTAGAQDKMKSDTAASDRMKGSSLTLSGSNEVPPVTTTAKGSGSITVAADKSVSGSVTTSGMTGTAAHIHTGAAGANGPVIVPLTKTAEDTWSVPSGAKLTDEQYTQYTSGNLYVNVHTAAHPGGELRAQLSK